jgi:hypothetical protein
MDDLLARCIVDPDLKARIGSAIVAAASDVIDVAGKTRSILTPDSTATAAQVDRTLTSTYELRNTGGELVRTIEVPGIIISVDRPVVLTTDTALAPLELS